ncbi:SPW repeat protein [Nocardioides sp. NPDC051685]|uniref:SPW repeat protein n=1 Tax=Nocardioides sp. NPDC051685 TaxID=3364334 RepID=UPI00378A0975
MSIQEHPDIAALRDRFDLTGSSATAQVVDGVTLMAGLYLAISPWVVGFNTTASSLMVSNLIIGLAVSLLALGFASAFGRTHGLAWTVPLMGAWAIVSLWLMNGVDTTGGMIASNVIVGAVIALCGLGSSGLGTLFNPRR